MRIGRSKRSINPDTKLFAISCIPKPIPRARAPETIAKPPRSTPAWVKPKSRAIIKPTYPNKVINASRAPRSIAICCSHLLSIQFFNQPSRMRIAVNIIIPPISCAGTNLILPTVPPSVTSSNNRSTVVPDSSQT